MAFWADVRAGKYATYAKWWAYLTLAVTLIMAITAIITVVGILSGIFSLIVAVIMAFIELPLLKCIGSPAAGWMRNSLTLIRWLEKRWVRAIIYAVMATIIWVTLAAGVSFFGIIIALMLTILAGLYLLGAFKKEEAIEDDQKQHLQPPQQQQQQQMASPIGSQALAASSAFPPPGYATQPEPYAQAYAQPFGDTNNPFDGSDGGFAQTYGTTN